MKKISQYLPILIVAFVCACTNPPEDLRSDVELETGSDLVVEAQKERAHNGVTLASLNLDSVLESQSAFLNKATAFVEQPEKEKKKEPFRHRISQSTIDSLNDIHEIFDPAEYDELAITYFSTLADQLNGKTYYADTDEDIMGNIMEILTTRLNDGTDIVLLIDKTGSMADDIEQVKTGLVQIEKYLSKFQNVNLAVGSYGDSNFHDELWFNMSELDDDISKISDFMDSYSTVGNPDTPESVNEAIVETVKETYWNAGNDRLVLVIGDAPSQVPPYSKYNSDDVVRICDSMEVTFNLYPIIIGSKETFFPVKERVELNVSAYPNPTINNINIDFGAYDTYWVYFYDMSGKQLLLKKAVGSNSQFDVSSFRSGHYLAQIMSEDLNKVGLVKFVVNH